MEDSYKDWISDSFCEHTNTPFDNVRQWFTAQTRQDPYQTMVTRMRFKENEWKEGGAIIVAFFLNFGES